MRKDWWVPLTGVAFVVVALISFVVGGEPPGSDKPAREIVEHYTDNDTAIMIGTLLTAIAASLLVWFGAVWRTFLRSGPDQHDVLSMVAFAGTVVVAIGVAIDATIAFALAEGAEEVEPTAAQALQMLFDADFMPMVLGLNLFLLASGITLLRSRLLPAWLGWVAVVLGVIAFTPVGFFAFLVGALWIAVVSVMLTMRRRAPTTIPVGG